MMQGHLTDVTQQHDYNSWETSERVVGTVRGVFLLFPVGGPPAHPLQVEGAAAHTVIHQSLFTEEEASVRLCA